MEQLSYSRSVLVVVRLVRYDRVILSIAQTRDGLDDPIRSDPIFRSPEFRARHVSFISCMHHEACVGVWV